MVFPKLKSLIDESVIKIEHKYLVNKNELVLDRLKCTGCGQCSIVCPKEAILFGPASAVYENKPKDLNAAVIETVDPEKCVMCGTCVVFCPFGSLTLYKDGEKVEIEDMDIVKHNSLPKLEKKLVNCSNLGRDGEIYWDSEIKVTYKMPETKSEFKQYYLNKCPGDCHKCVDICPTEAINFPELEDAWKRKTLIEIDDEKCVYCSACQNVCPQDNFEIKWTEIKTSGAYNKIFWEPIKEKLLAQRVILTEEEED